jgi:GTP cyclohydrolase I
MDTAKLYEELIKSTGEDINRDGLIKTPERASKAFSFITKGYNQTLDEVLNNAIFDSDNDEMVIVKILNYIQCVNIIYCLLLAKYMLVIFQQVK